MLKVKDEINRFKRLRKGYNIKNFYAEDKYERLFYKFVIGEIDKIIGDMSEWLEEGED